MRILLLNDSFPPMLDGVANAVINYAQVLTACGQDVMVGVPDYPNVTDDYPFPVVRYRSLDTTKLVGYRAGYPFSAPAIAQFNEFKPDVIHSHCPVSSNLLARTLRESTGAPVIFTYHTKFDIDIRAAVHGHLLQNELIKALVSNIEASDEVWTVSHGAGENLRSIGFKGDYIVMENGVDMPQGQANAALIKQVNAQCGLKEGQPVFLFTGRLRWYKGIRLIVEGLAQAMKAGADFRMVFVGDGSDREAIVALCRETGLTERCVFTGPVQDRELLRAFYSRADLFLFPSTFDTNGIVVREAAACGLAALLILGSCAAEGITDGRNGLLMAESPDALCKTVLYACAHPQALRRLGENAQRELYLSWDTAVRRALERYPQVIEREKKNPTRHRFDLFPLVSDWLEVVNRTRELSQQVINLLR